MLDQKDAVCYNYGMVIVKEHVMQAEKELVFNILSDQWQFVRENHGSLFDRGSADSYYGRRRTPHYGGVGGDSGPRVEVNESASVAEYMAGYDYNEKFGDKKRWD